MLWIFVDRDHSPSNSSPSSSSSSGSFLGFSVACCLLVLAFAAGPSAARETFEDATTTLVVEVPVEVTLDGEPVRDLGPADFELYDDGDRQEILSVETIDLATVEVTPEAPIGDVPVVARRHFLILFDLSFSSPKGLERGRQAALELVRDRLHPADLVSVATWSLTSGPDILLGFTPDRSQVETVLESLEGRQSLVVRSDPLRVAVNDVRGGDSGGLGDVGGGGGGREPGGALAGAQAAMDEAYRDLDTLADRSAANQGQREITEMGRSIEFLAETLRSVDGRKHVVFFSQGFDTELLLGTTDENRRQEMIREVQTTGNLFRVDSDEYFGSARAFSVIDDMVEGLRRADCTVHTVDVGGLRADGNIGAGGRGSKDGLFMIAEGTGGDFYENFNDLGTPMSQMLERTSVTYVLTFQPTDVDFDGDYRKLKVKVPDLPRQGKIVHRPGWFSPDPENPASGLEQQFSVAQRLWEARSGGDIEAHVLAAPLRTEEQRLGGPAYVPVMIEIDGASFFDGPPLPKPDEKKKRRRGSDRERRADASSEETPAEVFLYALSATGRIVDHFAQRVTLDPRTMGTTLTENGFKIYAPMLLDEGTYSLRALVRNGTTGRTGLRIGRVDVPPLDVESPVLLPPFFPEPTDRSLLVRGRRDELPAEREPAYPFFQGNTTYVPAVRPALRPGDAVPVFLAAYGLDDGVTGLESALYDAEGNEVIRPRWKLDPRLAFGEEGLGRTIAAFEVPNAAPGDYELRVTVLDDEGRRSTTGRVGLRVLGVDEIGGSSLLALSSPVSFEDVPDPNAPPGGEAMASAVSREAAEADAAARDEFTFDLLEQGYRRLLERLDTTGRSALVAELASLEARAAGERAKDRWSKIGRTELDVVRKLAENDPESLVPLLLLHQEVYLEHEMRRRPFLEFHSRNMVSELADLYAGRGRTEGARVVAARALSSLGGHLQADGRAASLRLFERAVDLDPTNEAALLGLAAYREKRGGPYAEAVDYLERLVERRPESREGRLRLAVNQLRVAEEKGVMNRNDRRESAESHLRRLVDGPEADWIHSLAAQELARHLGTTERRDEALEVLRGAIERRPEDQKLHVLLAYFLDRGRRSHEAGKLARRLSGDLATSAPADRGRYNRWGSSALAMDRQELVSGATQRMPQLQAAVDRVIAEADR